MNKKVLIDKQALIDKWENETGTPTFETRGATERVPNDDMYTFGYGVARKEILEDLKQLDEPKKLVVPKFVAEWFEEKEGGLENAIFYECVRVTDTYSKDYSEFQRWLVSAENNPIETLVRMKDGYEVEKEPKWKIINDQKYCLTSIEAGYGNSLHWAFDSTKKRPILFDNEETAMYTAYITGGIVEKVEV